MKLNTIALALLVSGSLCGCQPSAPGEEKIQTQSKDEINAARMLLDEQVDHYTQAFLHQQPTLATMLAVPQEQAGGEYNSRFPDYSVVGMKRLQQTMEEAQQALSRVKTEHLNQDAKMHQQILTNIFEYYTGDVDFSGGYIDTWGGHLPYIINQISGPLIDVPKLMQVQQSVSNEQEVEAYLIRLAKMGEFVDQVVGKFKADEENGIILPKKLHPKTLAFFNRFLEAQPAQHELVTTFAAKLKKIDGVTEAQRKEWVAQATALVETVVYPAYNRARDAVLESEAIASNNDGIWSQPQGEAFYRHEIRFLGDSDMSAEEIHQLGLTEVDRISTEMDKILKANGYSDGTVGERMKMLAMLPGQVYDTTDEGRQALLTYLNEQIHLVMEKASTYYGTVPEQGVEVRRIPPVSEAGEAGGFYSPPSLDGSRPGIYWINLRDMSAVPKFGLKTLTYHEAVPGHHFQIALNMAQQNIGLLRQNAPYNAYVEGWALYSEYFTSEYMGMYDDDPLGNLGRLQAELYRAVRLVVDTGLHYKHWTREQAIDYFHATTGTSLS
ncbi:DUF885 domain-containing protein, partial [Alteromonas sp. 14N.309.X.WAT.G.H12]|uniref:DUF885 domain-containing protein n=1 Tax=Alteromonas sp. 14N.309.X.WAT.G.H12 TaxID=3120824 RepID=UPI002FD4D0D7